MGTQVDWEGNEWEGSHYEWVELWWKESCLESKFLCFS